MIMDILPYNLVNLLKNILAENVITSWRIQQSHSLTLSIRFDADINDEIGSNMQIPFEEKRYRRKPPSCINRDMQRHKVFLDNTKSPRYMDTGFQSDLNEDQSIRIHQQSTPGPAHMVEVQDDNNVSPIIPPGGVVDMYSQGNLITTVPEDIKPSQLECESKAMQTEFMSNSFSCQATPLVKKKTTQTINKQWSQCTQTKIIKSQNIGCQAVSMGDENEINTENQNMNNAATLTDCLSTRSCHMQTVHRI